MIENKYITDFFAYNSTFNYLCINLLKRKGY